MIISRGDATVFFTRPIAGVLLLAAALALAIALLPAIRRKREEVFKEEEEV
jgi:TctA family transporter